MPKNLVYLADGTRNDRDIEAPTNVYKLYQRLRSDVPGHERLSPDDVHAHFQESAVEQITQYDAGVGSAWGDIVGMATGFGISANIKKGYHFLSRFYEPGDRIYLFGFSRGAYTVRSLAGMIGICGVPRRVQSNGADLLDDAALRTRLVDRAYAIYKTAQGPSGAEKRRQLGLQFIDAHGHASHRDPQQRAAHFIGVWDTVRALGLPVHWRDIEIPYFAHRFHDHSLGEHVRYAFHALSMDDDRILFHPTIWNEPTIAETKAADAGTANRQTFSQVWFPGVHADVGGGYAETGLSDVTLAWMINHILNADHPLHFYAPYEDSPCLGLHPKPHGTIHDPRNKPWKKLLYQKKLRAVCRGKQKPGYREIKPVGRAASLSWGWLERFEAHFKDDVFSYDPENVREHPASITARQQLRDPTRPLPGPFEEIDRPLPDLTPPCRR